MEDIHIVTPEELRQIEEDETKSRYQDACIAIREAMDKLSEAGKLLDPKSEELFKLLDIRIALSEPLARVAIKGNFQDWMYDEWKKQCANTIRDD